MAAMLSLLCLAIKCCGLALNAITNYEIKLEIAIICPHI